jgi:hypothetical protein
VTLPATDTLALVAVVVFAGGVVHGLAGFGNAVVSTALLATLLDPATAVVVVVIPVLAANAALVTELSRPELSRCLARFWPYLGAAVAGTLVGMAALDRVPAGALALGLGVLTLAYVVLAQPYVTVPGEARLRAVCFRPGPLAMGALGLVSGAVFGASNVAVQVVAYLDSLSLDRSTFVGVLATILVGVSAVRVAVAFALGLYAGGALALSLAAVAPGLVGVGAGRRLRGAIPERARTAGTFALLSVVGVRLLTRGVGL